MIILESQGWESEERGGLLTQKGSELAGSRKGDERGGLSTQKGSELAGLRPNRFFFKYFTSLVHNKIYSDDLNNIVSTR